MRTVRPRVAEAISADQNILSRALKLGFDSSIREISAQMEASNGFSIESGVTDFVLTPSNFFEYCGINSKDILDSKDLLQICRMPDPGDADQYISMVFDKIKDRVHQASALTAQSMVQTLNGKMGYLPSDSKVFVNTRFIKPLVTNSSTVDVIKDDISFHLLCAAPVYPKYIRDLHLNAVRLALGYVKKGTLTSVGKLLPSVWKGLASTPTGRQMPGSEKMAIDKLLSLHQVSDFLDSDLIHLAVAGLGRVGSGRVHCLTEDSPQKLRQRVLAYKGLLRFLIVRFRSTDKRPESDEFKGLDLKYGYVNCFDRNFSIVDSFSVQRLKRVALV